MSGRKYSQIELANNVREALNCRLRAADACARTESLVEALAQAAQMVPALESAVASARESLASIRQQLQAISEKFEEAKLMQQSLAEVQQQQRQVEQWRVELEQIINTCREGHETAVQRAELVAVRDYLERQRGALEPWLRDIYAEFTAEVNHTIKQIDQEIGASGTSSVALGRIPALVTQFEEMIQRVSERREMDAHRRYVAQALEQVCRELAFAPRLLPQSGPLEDLVLEVNTFAYGLMHFRLQLDGMIRSQSELIEASCCTNFTMIEDKLRSLGVLSGFRYEADQQPVRLRKDEQSLPGSESGALKRSA